MYIDNNIIPILALCVGSGIAITSIYTKYRLKVEQIKADAMVRAEEIKAKNQLEIEKLLYKEENKETVDKAEDTADNVYSERSDRDRLRY